MMYSCLKEELIYFEDCVDFTFLSEYAYIESDILISLVGEGRGRRKGLGLEGEGFRVRRGF